MLADSELKTILEAPSFFSGVSDPVENVLKRAACCPICRELFSRSDDFLTKHLRHYHADRLVSSGLKQITDHCVEEGAVTIFICPHCHFAVGVDSHAYGYSPTSRIRQHVQECPSNLSARRGPAHVSCFTSSDVKLIEDYRHNCAEIELFQCPQCNHSYGSAETLARHLALDHSSARREDLTEEQLQHIRLAAQGLLDRRATPKTTSSAVPVRSTDKDERLHYIQLVAKETLDERATSQIITSAVTKRSTDVETPKPRARAGEREPPQSRDSHQNISHPPVPIHDNALPSTFSREITQSEIIGGYVVLPPRLSSCFSTTTQVKVHLASDENATDLCFCPSNRRLAVPTDWFRKVAIEPGDTINFRILRVDLPEIQIWTEWQKALNYMLRCPAEDFEWERLPIRDCLIRVFETCKGPIHYRSLYSKISKHRELAVGSVIATLSRHQGVLFVHSGRGMWSWLKEDSRPGNQLPASARTKQSSVVPEVSDAIWKIVAEIEEADVVYNLLKRTRDSLSFAQICQKIAASRGIDWHELRQTGFLNAEDKRLKRLDNGHFALREWFDERVSPPLASEIDSAAEKKPMASPMNDSAYSLPPRTVAKGGFSILWTVICRMLGFFLRLAERKSHG